MGTILAVRKGNQISIGANCRNIRDVLIKPSLLEGHGCILKVGENYIGLNSSPGFQQAFEKGLFTLSSKQPILLSNKIEIQQFFTRMHELLRNHASMYVNYQQGQEFELTPMNALILNRSGLFKVDSSRATFELSKYWALGGGESFALGAAFAAYETTAEAEDIVRLGLKAANEFELSQSSEIEIYSIRTPNLSLADNQETKKEGKTKSEKKSQDRSLKFQKKLPSQS